MNWPESWTKSGSSVDDAVKAFLSTPNARWDYWSKQKIFDWLCEDQSGGKENKLLPKKAPDSPCIDSLCWDLGISTADRYLHTEPERCARATWLFPPPTEEPRKPVEGRGKSDFFKLFVWDAVLAKAIKETVDKEAFDKLLEVLRLSHYVEETVTILEGKSQEIDLDVVSDILVLAEFPVGDHELVTKLSGIYHVCRPPFVASGHEEPHVTAVLAKKALFEEPKLELLDDPTKAGQKSHRIVGCELKRKGLKESVHVLGVHLPASGHNLDKCYELLAKQIRENTVAIAGDFNVDIRTKKTKEKIQKYPELWNFVQAGLTKLPEKDGVTTCKQRTPYQAQVTKMFLEDKSMKLFLLLRPELAEAEGPDHVKGFMFEPGTTKAVTKNKLRNLPSKGLPSDHCPIWVKLKE